MRPCTTSGVLPPLSSSQQVAAEPSRTNQSVLVREVKDDDDFKGDVGKDCINIVGNTYIIKVINVVGNTYIFKVILGQL